jgi:phage protein D
MTDTAVEIYEQGQDFFVPTFEVWHRDRKRLADTIVHDITEVTYSDHIERIDTYQLTLNNWDAEKLRFKYSDGNVFLPGTELELWMGYYGRDPLRRMITGPITSMEPSFPASGQPTIAIRGQNLLYTLQNEKASVTYPKMTDSEIAQAIGKRLEITIRTDPTARSQEERYQYIFQRATIPTILFLLERARRIGYDLYVDEENGERFLYFGPSLGVRRVTYQLTYGRSLIHFEPNLNTTDQVDEVEYHGWDNRNKRPIRHTARRSDLRIRELRDDPDSKQIKNSFLNAKEVISDCPVETVQEAQTLSREILERNAKEMLTGSGSTVGLPNLVAGSVVRIDGLGTRFSGRYFVTSTTHTIGDSGYTTRFECRREEV